MSVVPARLDSRGSFSSMMLLLGSIGLLAGVFASPVAAQSPVQAIHDRIVPGLLAHETTPLSFRFDIAGRSGVASPGDFVADGFDLSVFSLARTTQTSGFALLGRYRSALERESRRLLEKDPSIFRVETVDQDGYPIHRVQRNAMRIFQGANSRMLSQMLELAIEETAALRHAQAYVEGVRFDVMSGGGVRMDGGSPERRGFTAAEADESVAASFGLVIVGRPRLELATVLPGGIRTRVEVPLTSPGIRTTMSRRLTPNLRGTLSGGVEDAGSDRWISAGVAIRF